MSETITETVSLTEFQPAEAEEYPISITDKAFDQLLAAIQDSEPGCLVRVSVRGGGCSGYLFDLKVDADTDPEEDIFKTWENGERSFQMVIDCASAPYLNGVELDYVHNPLGQSGFKFGGGDKVKKTCGCGSSFST